MPAISRSRSLAKILRLSVLDGLQDEVGDELGFVAVGITGGWSAALRAQQRNHGLHRNYRSQHVEMKDLVKHRRVDLLLQRICAAGEQGDFRAATG